MHMKNILRLSRRHLRRERPNSDHLFNTPAGTLDLNSMKLNPHKAEDYLTRWSETYYDPSATCPMWDAFIAEIMPNQKVLHYFQRCLGYAMHGSTEEQIAFFLHGRGANGKTTALETITSVLGDYAKSGIDGDFFSAKPSGGNVQYQDAGIQDARFVMVSETPIGKRMDESRFKRLVGGETITVSKKYVNEWTIRVTAKFFIATNHKPTVKDVSDGVWRRIQMIPFDVYIPLNQQDKTLEAKLRTESSGILNWLLKGYKEWRRIGLQPPPEVLEATQEYRVEQDTFGQFVTERLVVQPWAQLSQKGAYETYLRWCMEMGIDHPLSMITFGQALAERVKILKKTRIRREGKVVRGWQGIGKRRIK
jgi:putative DNA primase/helicase